MNILYATETVTEAGIAARGRTSPLSAALAFALFAFAAVPADAASALAQLNGSWSGTGRINLTDGKAEDLKCTAYYTPKGGGSEVGVACGALSDISTCETDLAA